ncbi:MAG: response regulator [Myxococcales bacterium]|nr:response regulator [Myxococcales bacterium]
MIGRVVGGKYTLERELARGGMGAIWVAHDPQLQRRVALKLISPDQLSSEHLRGRFQREAMAVAQLRNPHVVQIYDYGVDNLSPFIVMELLEGEDLETRLGRQKRLALGALIGLLGQAAKAISAAHGAGIVHRDLKPGNLFLARGDSEETLKVLDFGVAAVMSSSAGSSGLQSTRSGALIGTPHYMSPEQVHDSSGLDHRSDLWSLGVIAYRALTGRLPFPSESVGRVLVQICTEKAPRPSEVAPDLPPALDAFFERALAKDPTARFQTAREMASALAALADAEQPAKIAKILVVDDEPAAAVLIRQRFRQQIRKGQYEFVFAGTGEEALDQLRRHPDCVVALSDINMPGMDGLTFLSRVGEVNPVIKVIMVSAYSDMSNIRTAMNRGAFDFLVKPIDFKDLETTLEKTVKHVLELQKVVRSTEENSILRMFVNRGIFDRLLPGLRDAGVTANEVTPATVGFLSARGLAEAVGQEPPDEVVRRLNLYFEVMAPEVTLREGVVDKFIGDTLMVVFRGEGHLHRCVKACLVIRKRLRALAAAGGDPSYRNGVSIGIDAGQVLSGSIGSQTLGRLDYTVLGTAVGTAARLEALAGKDEIVVGEWIVPTLREAFLCELVGERTIHGRAEPVSLHRVVGSVLDELTAGSVDTGTFDPFGSGVSGVAATVASTPRGRE